MKIMIAETGEMKAIEYVDPRSGVESSADLMGDADYTWTENEDGESVPCLPLADFEWWDDILDRMYFAETTAMRLDIDWADHESELGTDLEGQVQAMEMIAREAIEAEGR